MSEFFDNFASEIGIIDFIDVAIIAFVIFKILQFIRETRAEQLVKGLLILVVAMFLSGVVHLYALNWILINLMQFGIIALVIVFQPELRRALEFLGRSRFLRGKLQISDKNAAKTGAAALTTAVDYFSANKVGALIIIERDVALNDFAETGAILNSELTPELLENIFYAGAPLHDGAVIITDGSVHAARCVLPLTRNRDLPPELGMRHRAGIGITEVSDAYAIIVSEETGIISTAQDGKLTRFLDIKSLEKALLDIYLNETEPLSAGIFKAFARGGKNASK
ncbi:MAG: diadenylate cyclase CdaA [Clostridiales Family XIII bacterium]|jgi:diadenylate cyclase|nr:diadenylate cyclase CdaA [Clostridiales Family XIII bacterium]